MAADWYNDGHTIQAKYSDRNCNVIMVINCPSPIACGGEICHVNESAQEYGWEVFAGFGDFDLSGNPKSIEWHYAAPEEIELRTVKE